MKQAAIITLALSGGLLGATTASAEGDTCLMLRSAVVAGEFLTSEYASETPCREEQPRLALAYDRAARAPIATQALPAGTYLGRLALKSGAVAPAGKPLDLIINDGPVTITRTVRPVFAARSGQKTFVETADGTVLSVRFISAEAAR